MYNSRQRTRRYSSAAASALGIVLAASAEAQICGDLNGELNVDVQDLYILLSDFGCDDGGCVGDVDGDGDTDQADLAWLLIYFGCPDSPWECGECEPQGVGTIDVHLQSVDNSDVGQGDDASTPNFHGGETHFTFDLFTTITGDNDWTTQKSVVEPLSPDVEIFRHSLGDGAEPPAALVASFPALRYDTFYSDPPEMFDDGPWGLFAVVRTADEASAIWFDAARPGAGGFTSQRFTLVVPAGSDIMPALVVDDCAHEFTLLAQVTTDATCAATGADFLHRDFVIVDLAQPTCPGDVDGSGEVDQGDLGSLLGSYNRAPDDPMYDPRADLDCDGDVDQGDLGALLAAYGSQC